jgi:DNA polymerase-3 subunit gamma/tau
MLLKALDEVRRAPNPSDAVDMAIVRLAYAADLPGPEEALKRLQSGEPIGGGAGGAPRGGGGGGGASAQLAPRPVVQPALPNPQTFEQVVALIGEKREIGLQMDVERFVRPVEFQPGRITFEPAEGAPANLATRLTARLRDWTGRPWFVVANGQRGGETLIEQQKKARLAERAEVEADPFVKAILDAFPGATLGEIRTIAPTVVTPEIPDAVEEDDD